MFKDFEVFGKVFDEITIRTLIQLRNARLLKVIVGIVKEGKESVVCSAKDFNDNWIALKIYRILHSDFKKMYNLLILDPRFSRVKRDRKSIVFNWCKREYKNLVYAFKKNISVPKPLGNLNNVIVLEFIGENGIPAPQLREIKPNYELYLEIIENLKKLKKIGLAHGDLSEYNILVHKEKPYFIDFSQGVREDCKAFKEYIEKDLERINNFFKKFLEEEKLIKEI
jgi:RIO kinase 1